jgi:hypothetical protein
MSHINAIAGAEFSVIGDDHCRLTLPMIGMVSDVDRLHRERGER